MFIIYKLNSFGDWGLGIGEWGFGVLGGSPNPTTTTPKPQNPIPHGGIYLFFWLM